MRDLKFRVWDGEKMLTMPLDTNFGISRFFGFVGETDIVMQFTGLLDKNGKEIYEGDIVKKLATTNPQNLYVVGKIEFEKGIYYFCPYNSFSTILGYIHIDCLEVIGNLHQNPELFKGE